MICIDCGTEFEGNYCPKCGQPATTKRITMADAMHSIFVSFLMGDSKFVNTSWQLFVRPGEMVRHYIYGRRAKLMAPVPMLVRLVAVYLLIMFLANTSPGEYHIVEGAIRGNIHSDTLMQFADFLSHLLSNTVLYSLLSASLFVVPYYWAFGRKSIERHDGTSLSLNIAEQFCVLVYVACQYMWLSLLTMPFKNLWLISEITTFIYLLLPVVMYRQLYKISWIQSIWRCLLACVIMAVVLSLVVMFVFGVCYGIDEIG